MLDYAFDEYFLILYYFKTGREAQVQLFKQSVVELACRVQRSTTSLQQFIHIHYYDKALPV